MNILFCKESEHPRRTDQAVSNKICSPMDIRKYQKYIILNNNDTETIKHVTEQNKMQNMTKKINHKSARYFRFY